MGRWLAPLLPRPQRWVLHDRDADLLALAARDVPAGAVVETRLSDVTQLGVIALALILGRPIAADEYPSKLGEAVSSAWAMSASGGLEPLTRPRPFPSVTGLAPDRPLRPEPAAGAT